MKATFSAIGVAREAGDIRTRWRWIIALMLLAIVVTGFFDRISVAVLFTNPEFNFAIGTGFNPASLGLLMTSFLLAYALSALLLSFIGDLIGPRMALGGAAGLWGMLMIAMGMCNSFAAMMGLRVLLGISEGPQFSLIAKTIQRWFPPSELGRANSIWMVGSPLGSAIGFPLTIWLVSQFGWRSSFYVLGLLNLLLIMPLAILIVRDAPTGPPMPKNSVSISKGDVTGILKNPKVWMLSIYSTGLLTYLWGLNGWLPTYLQTVRHFDLHQMGFFSSLPFIFMFVGEIASGIISDRLGRRVPLSILGLVGAGMLLLVATHAQDPRMAAILIALSAGSWGLALPSQFALATEILPHAAASTGIGIINGIGNLVGACAPAVIGWIVAETGDFQAGLLVVVLTSVVSGLALTPLIRSH